MTTPPPARRAEPLSDAAARLIGSPARVEIVQHLQIHGPLNSQQLADLSPTIKTRNAINRHLTGMLEDGWIRVAAFHQGRGSAERTVALADDYDWAGLIDELNRRARGLREQRGRTAGDD